jgi:hypothetical protein
MLLDFRQRLALLLAVAVLPPTGCAYRLPPITPASQELIHVVANASEQYAVEVNTGTVRKYDVPEDGRIKVGIPPYHRPCGVYLFDAIKVGGYADPFSVWTISITRNGKTVHKQSLRATQKSPTDDAGYHIIKISPKD